MGFSFIDFQGSKIVSSISAAIKNHKITSETGDTFQLGEFIMSKTQLRAWGIPTIVVAAVAVTIGVVALQAHWNVPLALSATKDQEKDIATFIDSKVVGTFN